MNSGAVVIVMVVVWMTVNDTNGDVTCPHPDYVAKHVCTRCTYKKAKETAIQSNKLRQSKRQSCVSHVFKGSNDSNAYYVEGDFCILREPVNGWYCHNLLKNGGINAKCEPQIACRPRHRISQDGRLVNPGAGCGPSLQFAAPQNSEECKKTCHGSTATSRAVCSVASAVAAGLSCLSNGWFTLGFPCAGAVGATGTFSEGCSMVTNFADDGCEELCGSILKYTAISEITDYNKLLNDNICVLEETKNNYRWLQAVEVQGDVVQKQKEILDKLDGKKNPTLAKALLQVLPSDILNEINDIRQLYDEMSYSTEGLLIINKESEEFKREALQEHGLKTIVTSLYGHLSGKHLPSIYQTNSERFCNEKTFNAMNSYLAEGHMMLAIATELNNRGSCVPDLTEQLNGHLSEYMERCGCLSGQSSRVVQVNIEPLLHDLQNVVDIYAGPDLLLATTQFTRNNIDLSLDVDIVMKALAGIILTNPRDQKAVMEKLETIKYDISTKSFKVCVKKRCAGKSHCTFFRNSCWCVTEVNTPAIEACGYKEGYSGEYYSIAHMGAPRDLIRRLGLTPRSGSCISNNKCNSDCAINFCVEGKGCVGTSLTCWNNEERWARQKSSERDIVRCRNYEL